MSFLLDTSAISEAGRPAPDPGYTHWFLERETEELFLSAISVGELRRGIALLPAGRRKQGLQRLYVNIVHRFASQVIAVDATVAEGWGDLSARLRRAGQVVGAPDELIAATALANGLTVVTRNVRHFEMAGCSVLSPWSA